MVREDDAFGGELVAQLREAAPGQGFLRGQADGQIEFDGELQVNLDEAGVELERAHVGIEMGDVKPRRASALDLGAAFNQSLLGVGWA
jgi:hypothetical protein